MTRQQSFVLGGGLPQFSFNLICGPPGSGKTTLARQIMFALATSERPALCFTMLGEPTPSRAGVAPLPRYTQALITQMSQTAVRNRCHSLDQQLCRRLLPILDRPLPARTATCCAVPHIAGM